MANPGVIAPEALSQPLEPQLSPQNSRPRPRSRGISFLSDRSRDSEGKPKYSESPREKAQRHSVWGETSKANPNAALKEAQPGDANMLEQSTLSSIRDYDHKDVFGNRISMSDY